MTAGFIPTEVVIGGATVLGGAVAALWKRSVTQGDQQIATAEKVGRLEGRQGGIADLSVDVLKTVHDAVVERDKNHE